MTITSLLNLIDLVGYKKDEIDDDGIILNDDSLVRFVIRDHFCAVEYTTRGRYSQRHGFTHCKNHRFDTESVTLMRKIKKFKLALDLSL